jgi:hypothetical protein
MLCEVNDDAANADVLEDPCQLDHGFVLAIVTAWCQHLPLVLKPDHIMLLILQAIARHVNERPEELRSQLVNHEGQMRVEVQTTDCAHEAMVPEMVEKFREKVGELATDGAKDCFSMNFSTSSHTDDTVAAITLMDATQSFFRFSYAPMCGFPSITLLGTVEDWRAMKRQAEEAIKQLTLPELASSWLPAISPVLERFVAAASGEPVDACFWNAMCKRCGITAVYGEAHSVGYNGWMHVFFPSIKGEANPLCMPYSSSHDYVTAGLKGFYKEVRVQSITETVRKGKGRFEEVFSEQCPTMPATGIPRGLGSAPLMEVRLGVEIPLELHGGFVGFTQDEVSKAVCPAVSWYLAGLQSS